MDMAVEARYSHVPLTAKERGLFLVNAHFLPTTKKLIIIRNSRKGRPRNGGGDHHINDVSFIKSRSQDINNVSSNRG